MSLVGNSHIASGDASLIPAVLQMLRNDGIEIEGNPDIYTRAYSQFGVEDAREIRERAEMKAIGKARAFVIATPVISVEAQNALLKTLEDAPGNAIFILIVPNHHALLATVRSRSQILSIKESPDQKSFSGRVSYPNAAEFLAASHSQRLEMLEPLFEKNDDDKRDMSSILAFLASLESAIAAHRKHMRPALESLYRARKYLGDKGSLIKPLLEQIALLVPVMKT